MSELRGLAFLVNHASDMHTREWVRIPMPGVDWSQYVAPLERHEGHVIKISGPALEVRRDPPGSFATLLEAELDRATMDLLADTGRQVFGRDWRQPDRVWPVRRWDLLPRVARLEEKGRQARARVRFWRERVGEAIDVLKHGLPEVDDWY